MDYKPQSYFVTTAPAQEPLDLAEIKTHLKMSATDSSRDTELLFLAKVVGSIAEKLMHRDLITRTYTTYRSNFDFCELELRRSRVQSIDSIAYLKSGNYITVSSSTYYLAQDTDYAKIVLVDGMDWPTDLDVHEEAVRIIFKSGYGNTPAAIPDDIRQAMLQHLANIDSQRGDCNELPNANAFGLLIPYTSKLVYDLYRLREVTI